MNNKAHLLTAPRLASQVFAGGIVGAAITVLVYGWALGHDATVRLLPEFPAMVPSTAISFILLGLAFALIFRGRDGAARLGARMGILLAAAIALVNLATIAAGGNGIDALFAAERFASDRMAIVTSTGVLAGAWCLWVLQSSCPYSPANEYAAYLALCGLSGGMSVVAGQLFDPRQLNQIPFLNGISLTTALLFSMLFAAILLFQLQNED